MLLQLCLFFPLCTLQPTIPHSLQQSPHHCSCPWIMHISSLASPFPILFLISPCLFCTYQLYFLFPVPFPPFSFLPLPTDNHSFDLHIYDSVSVLFVCSLCFLFYVFYLNFIIFFPSPFSPLYPPTPSNHHTAVHVHESFFLFAQSLCPYLPLPP